MRFSSAIGPSYPHSSASLRKDRGIREQLERLERARRAAPADIALTEQALRLRARIEGPGAYRAALDELELWDRLETETQDRAIAAVAAALPRDIVHDETRVFSCADQTHRIAVFRLLGLDHALHLIPGARGLSPFLIGASPVLEEEMGIPGGRRDLMLAPYPNAAAILNRRERTELPLRLPTGTEWEHACRGGARSRYFWGEAMDRSYCWFALNSRGRLHSVLDHSHKANGFGLIDPLGQVWELCQDGAERGLRGGAIDSPAHQVTCDSRRPVPRRPERHLIGIRWCAEIPAATDDGERRRA